MKRLKFLFLTLATVLILSGCDLGKPEIKLTSEESDAIAQYCAHLLMKYGAKDLYKQKLMDPKDFEDALEERAELLNPSPEPTAEITPEPTEGPEQQDDPDNPTASPDVTQGPDPAVEGKTTTEDPSELFTPDVFSIKVSDTYFGKSYKSDTEYFTLTAPEGKKVAAFTLEVKNITSQTKVFDYNNYKAQFQLIADENTALAPEISLLDNDFRFNRIEIKPDGVFTGVVLFFADADAENFIFRILGEDLAYELNQNNVAEVDNGN